MTMDSASTDSSTRDGVETATTEADNPESGEPGKQSAWRSAGRSAGVQIVALPLTAVLGIITTRLIVSDFGTDAYAQFGLLIAIGSLLPFADLGISAAIMNTVGGSDRPEKDPEVLRVLITSIRVLTCSGLIIVAVALTFSVTGIWPWLLGDGLIKGSGPIAAALCLSLIGIALPAGFGQRVLTALGKNHLMIAIVSLQTPLVLVAILIMIKFMDGAGGAYLPVLPYAMALLLAIVAAVIAARMIKPQIGAALRAAPRIRSVKGGKVFDVAWPMLIQSIALPIAMQSDRLVLSHVSDSANLATYNLASQLFVPVWRVVAASGAALWPIFALARAKKNIRSHSPLPIAAGFAAAATGACVAISLVSPWLARVASGGEITIPTSMLIAFSAFMICQAIQYPLGTFLTDAAGLRYQAFLIVLMVPFNLVISILLGQRYGAIGPVIGSAAAAFIFQTIGNLAYVQRRLRSEARGASTHNVAQGSI